MESMKIERWRKVPRMPGIEASDHGRIRRNGKLTAAGIINRQRRHRIIALAWLGLRPGQYVKFRRGRGCRLSNLYLCSSAQSHKRQTARGEAAGTAKLSKDAVRSILALRGRMIQREIARRFGVSRQTVSDIWCRKSWRHLRQIAP
jgi:hypothetical protein